MKILKKQLKKGIVSVKVEDLDDLWYLSQVIEQHDQVSGKTERKIKLKDKSNETQKVYKKTVYITLEVEKVEFHEYSDVLRVSGIVFEAPEDVQKGSHHTFNIELGSVVTITKKMWFKYHLERLEEAAASGWLDILVLVLDREEAFFALLKKQGYKILAELSGDVSKKADVQIQTSNFYKELISTLTEYTQRYKIKSIIVASPAFWKEELVEKIQDQELKSKITVATCSTADKQAITELLNRPEIHTVLKQQRVAKETKLVEELLAAISKNSLAAYGFSETKQAVEAGAALKFLLTTKYIHNKRRVEEFTEIESLMKLAESLGATITIINSAHEAGRKLDGLGGIAAVLRYRIG
ncbi:mRNA surveillance protein pelota [Candidatus Woesearchaeota archaeon]|nr:mRNA surveillance protein pelota [Candidatus Woesearchaeota archaeon]